MAISKILTIGDCGAGYSGKHLRQAIDYIMDPQKTGQGCFIGGINCQPHKAYDVMRMTKLQFSKTDKRQGYHLILSFAKGEVTPETAFEIVREFATQYLGRSYEAVYAVHDNTDHIHGHIIFNSVNFMDGRKYRYEKGDWARYIQPITNRLCSDYGLSTIEIDGGERERQAGYTGWRDKGRGDDIWSDMIKRDLDACITGASTYEAFLSRLKQREYEIKEGKYLSVRPPGMTRFRRLKTLGDEYTEARIRERIVHAPLRPTGKRAASPGRIVCCHVKRYKRAGLSGIQKRYFRRLYRIGQLRKRPYSQAWKYRDEIRLMHKLEEEYLFLAKNDIHSLEDIKAARSQFVGQKKQTGKEKSCIFRRRAKYQPLFDMVRELDDLEPANRSYEAGDTFFLEEHKRWEAVLKSLKEAGYSKEDVVAQKERFREEIASARNEEAILKRKMRMVETLLREIESDERKREREGVKSQDKKKEWKR